MEKINNVDLSKDKIILSDISKSGSQAIDAHFHADSKALSSLIERYGLKEILENMVQQNNIYRGGGDDEIYRAGKELDILEDKLKTTSAGALEQLNERSQHIEQSPDIIGKISYYGFRGEVVEVMEYTDTQEYLNAIKKEIDYNPDGFRHQTLTNNPEVKKSVDDIVYGAYGADNPHNLEWYSPQNVEARTIINDMVVKGNHILEVDIPITFNEFSNLFNIELKIDETLNQNIFSFERNGDVGHAYFAFKDGELDWIDEYDFRDNEISGDREDVILLSNILNNKSEEKEKFIIYEDKEENIYIDVELTKKQQSELKSVESKLEDLKKQGVKHLSLFSFDYVVNLYSDAEVENKIKLRQNPDVSNGKTRQEVKDRIDNSSTNSMDTTEYGTMYTTEPIDSVLNRVKDKSIFIDQEVSGRPGLTTDEIQDLDKGLGGLLEIVKKESEINKRISDINIFSLKNGGMAIRCTIDGEQQSAEKMVREDVNSLNDKTDRYQLVAKYFAPVLSEEREMNQSFKR